MDQREIRSGVEADHTRNAVTEKLEMIEGQVQETMEGTKSTIDNIMGSIQHVQMTIEGAKSSVDSVLETIKYAMDETIERVKYTTDLVEQVNKNPWIMFGSAILMGYVLSTVNYQGLSEGRRPMSQGKDTSFSQEKIASRAETMATSS